MEGAFLMSPNMRNDHQASCQAVSLGAGMLPTLSHLPPSLGMDGWVLDRPPPPAHWPWREKMHFIHCPHLSSDLFISHLGLPQALQGPGEKRAGFRETAQQQAAHLSERSHT